MALGVIDFYSPVAKGFAAGFFCGDFGGKGPIRINDILNNGAILPAVAGKIGFDWVCFGFVLPSLEGAICHYNSLSYNGLR
jgi:hypothetical protein